MMPQADYGLHTNWLSCFLIDESKFGCSRNALIQSLDSNGIETRPLWKPMHLQPLFSSCERYGGSVAEDLFRRGICLPSSSSLTLEDQMYVVNQNSARSRRRSNCLVHRRALLFHRSNCCDAFACFLGVVCVSRYTTFQIHILRLPELCLLSSPRTHRSARVERIHIRHRRGGGILSAI